MDWAKVTSTDQGLSIDLSFHRKDKLRPLDAAYSTIEKITKKYPPPYTLLVSGGVDSQAMLYAWHTSNHPYKTFCGVYNDNLNFHDIETMGTFSKSINADINYVNVDVISFLENELDTYANMYMSGSPQINVHIKMMNMVNEGTVLYSGDYILLTKYRSYYGITRNNMGIYNYKRITKKNVVPSFFLETPELAWSFQDTYCDTFADRIPFYDQKVRLFQQNGFPVIAQKLQTNGFEILKNYFDDKKISDSDHAKYMLNRSSGQPSMRKFDVLFRNPYERKFMDVNKFYVTGKLYAQL